MTDPYHILEVRTGSGRIRSDKDTSFVSVLPVGSEEPGERLQPTFELGLFPMQIATVMPGMCQVTMDGY